jgi:hypothetical protein
MTKVRRETDSLGWRRWEEIKLRWVGLCAKADPEYGSGIAKQLGIGLDKQIAGR